MMINGTVTAVERHHFSPDRWDSITVRWDSPDQPGKWTALKSDRLQPGDRVRTDSEDQIVYRMK